MQARKIFSDVLYCGWLLTLIAVGMAITSRQPFQFYTALRWVCCITMILTSAGVAYFALELYHEDRRHSVPFSDLIVPVSVALLVAAGCVALAVVFNPIVQFHFSQYAWLKIDKLAFGVVLTFAAFSTWYILPSHAREWSKIMALVGCAAALSAFVFTEARRAVGVLHENSTTNARVIETADEKGEERSYTLGVYEFTVAGRRFWGRTGNFEEVGDSVSVVYNPANPELNHGMGESSGFGSMALMVALAGLLTCYCIRLFLPRISESPSPSPPDKPTGTRARATRLRMKPKEVGALILVALVLYWLAGWIGVLLAAFVIASYFSVPLEQRERDKHKPDSFYDTPYGEG
jgi:hypothetical protein